MGKSKIKKAIVFGGSGFLGSHVADVLSERGIAVTIFDRAKSPYLRSDQKMIIGDMLDERAVEKAVKGCDYLFNFAGFADLNDAQTKPMDTIQLNIVGNTILMEAALKAKVKRFVYASTIYVYSQKGGFYRCSKQAAEIYIEEYQKRYGLSFTILRYSTIYGPRADHRNSIFRYVSEALSKGTVTTTGSGHEVRDYIHVRDAAELSVDVLSSMYVNKHMIISGHHPLQFLTMLEMLQEIMGKPIKLLKTPQKDSAHYDFTPYSFAPRTGQKLTSARYRDMGQGLLECLHEIYNQLEHKQLPAFKKSRVGGKA